MLKSIRIQNFKAWQDTGKIRLAPLTIIFGPNSAGKSSLGHLLLTLKQTAISSDRRRALHLGDENSLIDLGTFSECIYNHDLERTLSFDLTWTTPQDLTLTDSYHKNKKYTGDNLSLSVSLKANKNQQPVVTSLLYNLNKKERNILDVTFKRDENDKLDLISQKYDFVKSKGRVWPLDNPEKFYRISDQSRSRYQNGEFLADLALATETILKRIYYLGPLRDNPKRIYQWSGDTPEDVGQKGEYTIAAMLAAKEHDRSLNRGFKQSVKPFIEFIAEWLKDMGVINSFSVKPVAKGRKEYEVLIKTHKQSSEVKITDVGFGISQVLPALVEAFYCAPNSIIWMEQPEIHLHPQVQAELADVFISAIQARENGKPRNTQLIIESHSEHFLNRLQRRIAEEVISVEDVAIYFCKRNDEKGTELEELKVNLYGEIENWPEDFFGNEMADLTGRTIAAMKRQQKNK